MDVRKRGNEEWTLCIAVNFKENKTKLRKGVNEVRKGESLGLGQKAELKEVEVGMG